MSLAQLIDEILEDAEDWPHFEALPEPDQRRLTALYILEDPDIIADLLADISPSSFAIHLARIALNEPVDSLMLCQTIGEAVYPSDYLGPLIQGEIDHRYRLHQKYGAVA